MASSTELTKVLCVVCNKAKGIYTCAGCSQICCLKHSNDHRDELNKQLEEVAVEHDVVQQTLNQHTEDPQQHPLLKKISQWEEESIIKIRQTAEKMRNKLVEGATQHTYQMKQKLQILSHQLKQGREENDFSEIDLRQWTQKLEELKKQLLNPTTITIEEDPTSIITNIHIDGEGGVDIFGRIGGNAKIKENGRLAVNSNLGDYAQIRGKKEYNTGRYKLCFRIEQLTQNGWLFFGIITKSDRMQNNSYYLPSAYGWSNRGQIYANGRNIGGQGLEVVQNDIIILLLDCDQRKIELKNERSNRTMEMPVEINKCPFPWQFNLNLYEANTCVRILNSSD